MKQQGNHEGRLFQHVGKTFRVGNLVAKKRDCLNMRKAGGGGHSFEAEGSESSS